MIEQHDIKIRAVELADMDMIYEWRNDEKIRKNCFNSGPIAYIEHKNWFQNKIKDSSCRLVIAMLPSEPVGVVRFDIDSTCAEIDIYLNPSYLGQGLGKKVLGVAVKWAKDNLPGLQQLIAKVLPENLVSQKIFEKNGFLLHHLEYVLKLK